VARRPVGELTAVALHHLALVQDIRDQTGDELRRLERVAPGRRDLGCLSWELLNAGSVLGGPLVLSIWDCGLGNAVSSELQVTMQDLSAQLSNFQRDWGAEGDAA